MPFLTAARLWLETNIHPSAPWVILTLAIFLGVYATRKWIPALWTWFDSITPDGALGKAIQSLPMIAAGAIFTAFSVHGNYAILWWGAVAGAAAPALHQILKVLPFIPYQGAVAKSAPPVITTIALLMALGIVGCSSLGHVSDPTIDSYIGDACALLGKNNRPQLQDEAVRQGISLADITRVFETACSLRMKQGLEPARASGLAAAHRPSASGDGGAP